MTEFLLRDRVTISSRTRTSEGYLKVTARLSRTGVQDYRASDFGGSENEIVRVYRSPEEVFDAPSLASLELKPVTIGHPSVPVTADNWKAHAVGETLVNVVRDGRFVRADIIIRDQKAIDLIEQGMVELSVGYGVRVDFEAGTSEDGEAYDAVQRNIRGNHIALVDAGRCGPECKIDDQQINDCSPGCGCASDPTVKGENPVPDKTPENSFKVDGVVIRTLDEANTVIKRLQEQNAEDRKSALEARDMAFKASETHKAERRSLEDEISGLKSQLSDEAVEKRAEQRMAVIDKSMNYLPGTYDDAGKSVAQIARDTLETVHGAEKVSGMSDDAALAAFELLSEEPQANDGIALFDHLAPRQRPASSLSAMAQAAQAGLSTAWMRGPNGGQR